MHDATKVLLGTTQSTFKKVENMKGVIAAGTLVRLKSDNTITTAKADGEALGVSIGKDLSDIGYTSFVRKGSKVPVLLTNGFTPTVGAQVNFSDTTGLAIASGGGATAVNAVFSSSTLTGMTEAGGTANVAFIDFPGGL